MKKILLAILVLLFSGGIAYAEVTQVAPNALPVIIVGTSPISGTVTVVQPTAASLNATVTDGSGALTVDGTVTANAGTGNFTVIQGTGTNLHTVVDSGTVTAVTSITNPVAVTGTFWQATQPVSGTFYQATQPVSAASLPLPTGAATEAKQDTLNAKDFSTETTLAAVLAKIIAAPATEATLATLDGKVTACNTGAVVLTPTTTMNHAQVSIPVTAGGTLLIAANTSRKSLMIQNIGSFAMFCGNTGLSATTGFKVDTGASFFDDTAVFNGAVYCIGSGGTTTAAYREVQ